MKFRIFRSLTLFGYRWYFSGIAKNGEPILQSEGYKNLADAESTVALIRTEAAYATVGIEEK